jgi:transposase
VAALIAAREALSRSAGRTRRRLHVPALAHIVDQAAWHTTAKLCLPENISILPLPPKSPELNPVENIWQFVRENWLSNRIFESYEQIVDLCCDAWNKLRDQPWRIMSIGLRDRAHA